MRKEVRTFSGRAFIEDLPNKCPYCHNRITPDIIFGHKFKKTKDFMDVFLSCPDRNCLNTFVGNYKSSYSDEFYIYLNTVTKGNLKERFFDETINNLSSSFVTIYNQAYYAEQEGLLEICGVGYRKALEFLIKDYAIDKNPEDKEEIEKKFLSSCIKEYVNDNRVKSVAERAVWIGNDETHYVRRWEGRNLEDLKKLIELTVHWIQMEKLTDSFETEMSK